MQLKLNRTFFFSERNGFFLHSPNQLEYENKPIIMFPLKLSISHDDGMDLNLNLDCEISNAFFNIIYLSNHYNQTTIQWSIQSWNFTKEIRFFFFFFFQHFIEIHTWLQICDKSILSIILAGTNFGFDVCEMAALFGIVRIVFRFLFGIFAYQNWNFQYKTDV